MNFNTFNLFKIASASHDIDLSVTYSITSSAVVSLSKLTKIFL